TIELHILLLVSLWPTLGGTPCCATANQIIARFSQTGGRGGPRGWGTGNTSGAGSQLDRCACDGTAATQRAHIAPSRVEHCPSARLSSLSLLANLLLALHGRQLPADGGSGDGMDSGGSGAPQSDITPSQAPSSPTPAFETMVL